MPGQFRYSGIFQLLLAVLQGIQVVVAAVLGKKLLMVALLDDLSVGQKDDVVGMLDGTEAMGHDQHLSLIHI